jgi:hypothetical protein
LRATGAAANVGETKDAADILAQAVRGAPREMARGGRVINHVAGRFSRIGAKLGLDRSIDDSAVLFPDFQIFPDSVPVRFGDFRALASEHAMSGGEAACARFAVEPSWFFKPCSPTPGRREWLSPPARRWQD